MAIPQTSVSETMTQAYMGMLADSGYDKYVRSYVNEEASDEMPFGVVVQQGTADNQCLLLNAITDKLIGITVHSHAYDKDNELGTTGLKQYATVGVARRGRVWCYAEEAVTPASAPLVRAVAAGVEVPGHFRDSADAADLIDVSAFCRFLTSTTGAGLVLVEFDFAMFGADPLD